MTHLSTVFAVWDHNAAALAQDIGEDEGKVRQWRNRNSIPSAYWRLIIAAAAAKGKTLGLDDLLPPDPDAPPIAVAPVEPERVLICDLCDHRVTADTPCTIPDCPHAGRRAA